VSSAPEFRIGTASWTDPTLVKTDLFYPPSVKTAEARLRFYAERFNTVEVDSTYYALVSERNAQLWAERTPNGFLFNVKAYALLTQHPAEISRMPKELREMLTADQRQGQRLERPSAEVLDVAFQMFWSALRPLHDAGKLGMLTFQFPPYFIARGENFDYLARLPEWLPGASIAVEFRHPSWVRELQQQAETMNFLRSHGLYYTSIDAPEDVAIVPSFIAASGDQAYVRFHGRNRETWFKRTTSAAERFKYVYSERELQTLAEGLVQLKSSGVRRAFAIFNNCYQNFGIMNATTMAEILRDLV
jgi:uncharacterized protein YecE (DUF72 family)